MSYQNIIITALVIGFLLVIIFGVTISGFGNCC
jgi:hypothetical protein